MWRSHSNILNRPRTKRERGGGVSDISQVRIKGAGVCHYLEDSEHCEKMCMIMRAKCTAKNGIVNELTSYTWAWMNL